MESQLLHLWARPPARGPGVWRGDLSAGDVLNLVPGSLLPGLSGFCQTAVSFN